MFNSIKEKILNELDISIDLFLESEDGLEICEEDI